MKRTVTLLLLAFIANVLCAQNVLITVEQPKMEYDPMIFGQFIEHHHRQIYGGLFDPGNPLSDEDGFRKDVIDALKEIKVPIVRWPGGCFVSSYHWYDGVGPNRVSVFDKSWLVEDPNTFGTDEYIKWCRKVGCEPYICTNAGTGTMEEMSDWVEYCNLNVGKWGKQRIANGYPEPYNVKYWSVGNENYGSWELGAKTINEWGPLVRESSKLMRSVSPGIKLLAAANFDSNWNISLLKNAGYLLDYISVHGYYGSGGDSYDRLMMSTESPENQINSVISLLNSTGFGGGKIKIAFDEWNLRYWYHPGHADYRNGADVAARDSNDLSKIYTMADAVFTACFLNSCIRHCDIVKMACFSPIVNTRGAICTSKDGILKRTTFYVFKMYANLLEKYYQPVSIVSDKLTYDKSSVNVYDAILTTNEDGSHKVYSIINKDAKNDLTIEVSELKSLKKVKAITLRGRSENDYNEFGDEHVVPEDITLAVKDGKVSIPAHSVTFIDLKN